MKPKKVTYELWTQIYKYHKCLREFHSKLNDMLYYSNIYQ